MGIKLVTRPRLGLSHLREHKFKSSFYDTLNPLCNCGMDLEYSTHFLLQCPLHINETCTLMSNLNRINPQIFQLLCNFCQTHSFLGIRVIVTKRIYEFLTLLLTKSLMKHISECVSFLFPLIFLTNFQMFKFQHIFIRLRLNFILYYFKYNCEIIVSHLLIVFLSCILLTGG